MAESAWRGHVRAAAEAVYPREKEMYDQLAKEPLAKFMASYQWRKIVDELNEGGVPMPVQSVVEGAKLATFIDEAVEDSIKELEHQDGVSRMEKDSLHEINGKVFIQSMSVDVVQFVADAYRCLRY